MLFSSILGVFALVSTSVSALPAIWEDEFQALDDEYRELQKRENETDFDATFDIEKRQSSFYAITGQSKSPLRARLEIRDLQRNKPNQWQLFLIALQRFHDLPQSDKLSYYQISGIHGVPRVNWDSVGQCSGCSGADGYCTHDSILFLGWHRAYMLLFEQKFMEIVRALANEYPAGDKRAQMVGAAGLLRFPYWDWAALPPNGGNVMPDFFTTQTVTVDHPQGRRTQRNPMFRHDFTNPSDLVYTPFRNWQVTLRYPGSNSNTASSQTSLAVQTLNNIRVSMRDQLYNMFSTCDEFIEVASDAQGTSSSRCSSSLEGIHNTIHNAIGGTGSSGVSGGHMTYLATSAFDPLFWLHHTNVDRLFVMWQTIYPNQWSGSERAPQGTWAFPAGATKNLDSPLQPFHRDTAGNFWTTNQLRYPRNVGYTYPEILNTDGSSRAMQSIVNKLYGPGATATAGSTKRTAAPEPVPQEEEADTITPLKANNGSLYQYVSNIKTPRYALNGSYWIFVFNGEPTTEPTTHLTDPNLVGPVGVLAQPDMDMDKTMLAAYSVPLTTFLTGEQDKGNIPDLEPATVAPYLKENLVWKIVNATGQNVPPETVQGFEVTVFQSTATPPKEYELPSWSEFIPVVESTEQKAGGATVESLVAADELPADTPVGSATSSGAASSSTTAAGGGAAAPASYDRRNKRG